MYAVINACFTALSTSASMYGMDNTMDKTSHTPTSFYAGINAVGQKFNYSINPSANLHAVYTAMVELLDHNITHLC